MPLSLTTSPPKPLSSRQISYGLEHDYLVNRYYKVSEVSVATIGFDIKVADEVWIAAALLHRKYSDREDFTIDEIVERAKDEAIGGKHRPGVYVHVLQHCVANRPPNPGRYCMLLETRKRRRRLWRPGDPINPKRAGAKTSPVREDIPAAYQALIDWYFSKYAKASKGTASTDPILALKGLGKDIWRGEHPDKYVQRLREGLK
jgi:hypothetical protein